MSMNHRFNTKLEQNKTRINQINDPHDALQIPYPLGCIQWCSNDLILTAGGGGPTKSGIKNGFEILKFDNYKMNNHRFEFELKRHSWYNTGSDIVYCLRQHPKYPYHFIAGIGNNLVVIEMNMNSYSKPIKNNAFQFEWNKILSINYKYPIKSPLNTVNIKSNIEIKALPHPDDPYCVYSIAIHPSGKLIATGGTDGYARLWKYNFIDLAFTKMKDIKIADYHYKHLKREKAETEAVPEIERLLFDDFNNDRSIYLSICNRSFGSYIFNCGTKKIETILMDRKQSINYVFRDVVFIGDKTNKISSMFNKNNCIINKYCVCGVNSVRKNRRDIIKSYLYQYYISSDEWYRINYCFIMKSDIIRMISCSKTNNIISLHHDGTINIIDGLNLIKKSKLQIDGTFYMDIAISPNLYGNQSNNYTEYLLCALMNTVVVKPISLKPCHLNKDHNAVKFNCFSCGCLIWFFSIIIVIIGVLIGSFQEDIYPYVSTFDH